MTGRSDDHLLRELFAALRQADQRVLPEFDRLVSHARPRVGKPRWATLGAKWTWVGVTAMAAFLAVFFLRSHRTPQHMPSPEALALARSIEAWRAPTDTVLEVPTLRIPQGVPTLEFTSLALPTWPAPGATRQTRSTPHP
jgi:hypothetical protein